MVDREYRSLYAEKVRHFAAGVLTVDEYEARTDELVFDAHDPGIDAVWRTVWGLYDDFRTNRLRGKWALNPATKQQLAHCILFLYSDAEYTWPEENRIDPLGCLLGGVQALFYNISLWMWYPAFERFYTQRQQERIRWMGQFGDVECWPFLRRAEFEAELHKPRFFAGVEG